MVNFFFDKIAIRTRLGFLIAFFLLILSYFLTYISTQKVINQANRVNQTNMVIHDLDKVLSYVVHGESSFRGYLITQDPLLRENYERNTLLVDSTLKVVRVRLTENKEQQANLAQLANLVQSKVLWMDKFYHHFTPSEVETPAFRDELKKGIKTTEEIENKVIQMQLVESGIWQQRGKEVSEYTGQIKVFNTISIILAILFTLFSLLVYNKENKAKKEETKKAGDFRKQLETRIDELAELNKELIDLRSLEKYAVTGRIARTIAHEVRNPLTNINLSIEQLRTEVPETETTDLFFKMIIRNSDRINNLVSDLLDATRINELKFVDVNLNDILDESLNMALDRIALKQIKVIKSYDQNMCSISADIEKLKIAFLNIIVNAIEAMDTRGELVLETSSQGDKCQIKITDNGVGMSRDQVDKLFEPYFTTKDKGNGLGLANTQNIILGHNGSISGESTPGEGTTFTITLNS